MAYSYRKPTVAVVGAGAAGVAAAAECALTGFPTLVFDQQGQVGGQYVAPGAKDPSFPFQFSKGNLRPDKHADAPAYRSLAHGPARTAQQVCEQLAAILDFAGATAHLSARVVSAHFDKDAAQWHLRAEGPDGEREFDADVLILATNHINDPGRGLAEIVGPAGRPVDLHKVNLHLGVEPIGLPNLLLVDAPEPPLRGLRPRPLAVIEQRADYAQRYARQLEIKGPGAISVDVTYWQAGSSARGSYINSLREFSYKSHLVHPLSA